MSEVYREWAGRERAFRLRTGEVLDLEQACEAGIGEIYRRLVSGGFWARDVMGVLRLGLVGGGMDKDKARSLILAHFDRVPIVDSAAVAADVVIAIMTGIEPGAEGGQATSAPLKFSELSQIARVFHLSPVELRAMSWADLQNLLKGYRASGRSAEPPSEDEFNQMLAQYFASEDRAQGAP